MTTTPPKYQLWHPTRGISFSPVARSPNLTPQNDQILNDPAVARNKAYAATSSIDDLDLSALPKYKRASYPTPNHAALATNKTTPITSNPPEIADQDESTLPLHKRKALFDTATSDHPPAVASSFKMVDDLFYAAKKAPAGSAKSYWSYTHYRGKGQDGTEQKVKVHYCRSKFTMEKVCRDYFVGEPVLGFDLEWEVDSYKWQGVKRNVSLIQLASPSRIGLFHVALFNEKDEMVGPLFKSIMEDPNVTKVGVAIKGDTTRLRNYLKIDSKGLIELSHLYKLVTYSANEQYSEINKRLVPLATLVEHYLHLPLYKGQSVRGSAWSKALDMDQVVYSASDAYAGLQLYATLEHHRKQLDPCPPSPHHAEKNLPIRLADGVEIATNEDPSVDAMEVTLLESNPYPIKKRTASSSPARPKDSRVEIAEDKVACYRATHPDASATFLRAYYMWHDQGLDPKMIAQLLRSPPLQTKTVISYISTAIKRYKLPADPERMREEILEDGPRSKWPEAVATAVMAQS